MGCHPGPLGKAAQLLVPRCFSEASGSSEELNFPRSSPPTAAPREVVGTLGARKVCAPKPIPPPLGVPMSSKQSSDYEITGEVLGRGASGYIVSALDKATNKEVAIKRFKLDQLSQRRHQDMVREIQTQGSVDHPNVAQLQAVYRSATHTCLVIEHLDGGSLLDGLRQKGPLRESEAISAVKQLLRAVAHLHERGLVHRDIKLENIMWDSCRQDRLKLIDFGLCMPWKEGLEPMTRICGTKGCMAPELTKRSYTNKADLWSVGVAAHELLTGVLPSVDEAGHAVVSQRLSKRSPEAQSFVAALLAPSAGARMSAKEALRHRWLVCGPARILPAAPSSHLRIFQLCVETIERSESQAADPKRSESQVKKKSWPTRFTTQVSAMWAAVRPAKRASSRMPRMAQVVPGV